jgi:ferritin-like metal-binding protein YciE
VTPEEKTVQLLEEAQALEGALLQTLTAHVAITPRSEYRDLLERHAEETRAHLDRLGARLAELGEGRNPLQVAYGVAQTAVGQLIAAGKFPIDLLRGTGSEDRLLKNARDEAASEALEIATYDALEALAEAAGDDETATLAREHREQEEAMLAGLRGVIGQLARDAYAADVEDDQDEPSPAPAAGTAPPAPDTPARPPAEAVAAARAVASQVRDARLPIEDYDALTADQIVPKLRLLTANGLKRVEEHERAGRGRKRVLERIAKLRSETNGSQPADPRRR